MTLRKRLLKTIVLMFIIPAILIGIFAGVAVISLLIRENLTLSEFMGTDMGRISNEIRPGGIIFRLLLPTVGIALLFFLVAFAIGVLYISKSILPPLRRLKSATEQIRDGNLDFEILSSNVSEVNELCYAFDDMRKRLKASVQARMDYETARNLMLANISHDLRTPVTSIKGYVEGLRDGVATTPEMQQRYLDTIYAKAMTMERMIEQMSDFSELELGRMSFDFVSCEVIEWLSEIAADFAIDFEAAGAELTVELPSSQAFSVIDKVKLRRVLANLLSNALKYRDEARPLTVRLSADVTDELLHILVEDNGRGISTDALPKVFEGFYRSDPARGSAASGHGLGLSIARQITLKHSGKIWIKSEESVGTEVHINLKLKEN